MMVTYAITVVIVSAWAVKMITGSGWNIRRTPLDIPLTLFLFSQIVSTLFSIDPHVSFWGYYSRFNGGLLSTISYILLYYAFVSNFPKKNIHVLLTSILSSAVLVSLYAILEHFGIDRDLWVQDVQNRVFSTLGQPNWLAAYLVTLIPMTIILSVNSLAKGTFLFRFLEYGVYLILTLLFTTALLYTKSRSGIIAFFCVLAILTAFFLFQKEQRVKRGMMLIVTSLLVLVYTIGTPFEQLKILSLSSLPFFKSSNQQEYQIPVNSSSSLIEIGITGSGTIRKIVWKGAIDIFKNNPLIGTGVETFAQSYYQYRPAEHNMTSEWDFLYNKAHNEYLNFAATSGIFGLGSYTLFILLTLIIFAKRILAEVSGVKNLKSPERFILGVACGWMSILITNFFGFSVVIVQLFFFLLPAMLFLPSEDDSPVETKKSAGGVFRGILLLLTFALTTFLLFTLAKYWYADVLFAQGYHLSRNQEYLDAYKYLQSALILNKSEPFYYDEIAHPISQLAVILTDEKKASEAGYLTEEAIAASDIALSISPKNVNFWKTRTRVMYTLTAVDPKYLDLAIDALLKAQILSPTDPKITYNLGLLYDQKGETEKAISLLNETIILKPDYRDAYIALAYFYEKEKNIPKAKETLQFILNHIASSDSEAIKKLKEL